MNKYKVGDIVYFRENEYMPRGHYIMEVIDYSNGRYFYKLNTGETKYEQDLVPYKIEGSYVFDLEEDNDEDCVFKYRG